MSGVSGLSGRRWMIESQWFVGFAFGVTWAYGAIFVNLGPLQVVIERV